MGIENTRSKSILVKDTCDLFTKLIVLVLIEMIQSCGMSVEQRKSIIEGMGNNMVLIPLEKDSFFICKYEVTQEEWMAVMGYVPESREADKKKPVVNIEYSDAQMFIKELNLLTGKQYRLPTLWEWACAATENFTRNDIFAGYSPAEVGWYNENTPPKNLTKSRAFET